MKDKHSQLRVSGNGFKVVSSTQTELMGLGLGTLILIGKFYIKYIRGEKVDR